MLLFFRYLILSSVYYQKDGEYGDSVLLLYENAYRDASDDGLPLSFAKTTAVLRERMLRHVSAALEATVHQQARDERVSDSVVSNVPNGPALYARGLPSTQGGQAKNDVRNV
jgi:hypothetical protein